MEKYEFNLTEKLMKEYDIKLSNEEIERIQKFVDYTVEVLSHYAILEKALFKEV